MTGMISRRSRYPFDETVARLLSDIQSRGATVFAVVDHAGAAADVGLAMPPTKVLIWYLSGTDRWRHQSEPPQPPLEISACLTG